MKYRLVLTTMDGREFDFSLKTAEAVRKLVHNSYRASGVQIWDNKTELTQPEIVEFLCASE
jgi:hypothetical protein